MTRSEKLKALAEVLTMAAEKARGLSGAGLHGKAREAALAKQIEGIAMEFEALSSEAPATVDEDIAR